MDPSSNVQLAERLLAGIGEGHDPEAVAAMFSEDARFEVPGDDGVLPWIGHRTGRQAAALFISNLRALTEPISFEVEEIVASDKRAVVLGELATRIKATDKVVETAFAIVLTVSGGQIVRFQMLEDSFAVSRAACL
jgi:hypothetical protein